MNARIGGHNSSPNGEAVLFISQPSATDYDHTRIEAVRLATEERTLLYDGATQPLYAPSGHLLFAREGRIHAGRFDAERLELQSPTIPVLERVLVSSRLAGDGSAQLAFSQNGTLIHLAGTTVDAGYRVVRVDRDGAVIPLSEPRPDYRQPRFSPDGRRIAVGTGAGDILLLDANDGAVTQFTLSSHADGAAVWSPDGRQIVFQSNRGGTIDLYSKAADGTDERLHG